MGGILDIPNPAVVAFMRKAVSIVELKTTTETSIHEFDDSQYQLLRDRAAVDVVRMSFKSQSPLSPAAGAAVAAVYASSPAVLTDPEPGFQITLQVALAELRKVPEEERTHALEKLASIRLYVTGAELRSRLQELAEGRLPHVQEPVLARPGAPFWVQGRPQQLTALFPVYLKGHADDALLTVFAQQCAEARRGAGHVGMAPQLAFTHAGQAPPFSAGGDPRWDEAGALGGFLSMTVLPHHVSTPTNLDRLAWMLLTLPAHLDFSVKAFKASLHDHMRGTYEGLLSKLEAARCDTVVERPARAQRAPQRRSATPSPAGLLGRIRAKAQATAVRDIGAVLNRHKENRLAN